MIDGKLDPQAAAALPHHINPNGPTVLEAGTSMDAPRPQQPTQMRHHDQTGPARAAGCIIERVKGS